MEEGAQSTGLRSHADDIDHVTIACNSYRALNVIERLEMTPEVAFERGGCAPWVPIMNSASRRWWDLDSKMPIGPGSDVTKYQAIPHKEPAVPVDPVSSYRYPRGDAQHSGRA